MEFNHLGEAAWRSFLGIVCFILSLIVIFSILYPNEVDIVGAIYYNIHNWEKCSDDVCVFCLMMFLFWVLFTAIINEKLNRKYKEQEKEIEEREFRERIKEFMDNK